MKLLNEVSNRKGRGNSDATSPDLFGDYRGIPKRVTIFRRVKKSTAELTISEAQSWLDGHTKKRDDARHRAFQQMLQDLKSHQRSDDDTLAMMLERKRTSERLEFA